MNCTIVVILGGAEFHGLHLLMDRTFVLSDLRAIGPLTLKGSAENAGRENDGREIDGPMCRT